MTAQKKTAFEVEDCILRRLYTALEPPFVLQEYHEKSKQL